MMFGSMKALCYHYFPSMNFTKFVVALQLVRCFVHNKFIEWLLVLLFLESFCYSHQSQSFLCSTNRKQSCSHPKWNYANENILEVTSHSGVLPLIPTTRVLRLCHVFRLFLLILRVDVPWTMCEVGVQDVVIGFVFYMIDHFHRRSDWKNFVESESSYWYSFGRIGRCCIRFGQH